MVLHAECALVEFGKCAGECKADARARRGGSLAVATVEGLKDAFAQFLRHQWSVVGDSELNLVVLRCLQGELDVMLAILHGIGQHVRHDLCEAFLVEECIERFIGMLIL